MPLSIHLPPAVLKRVDARARALGLSRSGYITQTLEADLDRGGWSAGFFDSLRDVPADLAREASSLRQVTRHRRSRRKAPRL